MILSRSRTRAIWTWSSATLELRLRVEALNVAFVSVYWSHWNEWLPRSQHPLLLILRGTSWRWAWERGWISCNVGHAKQPRQDRGTPLPTENLEKTMLGDAFFLGGGGGGGRRGKAWEAFGMTHFYEVTKNNDQYSNDLVIWHIIIDNLYFNETKNLNYYLKLLNLKRESFGKNTIYFL